LEEDKSSNGKKRRADGEADGKISTKQAKKPYFFAPVDVPADASEGKIGQGAKNKRPERSDRSILSSTSGDKNNLLPLFK